MDRQQTITPGANVYGSDGEKVGTVATYGNSYVVVEKGFFFPKDYYIPMSAITETTGDGVYLSVTKDEALNQGWDQAQVDVWNTGGQAGVNDQYAAAGADRTYATDDTVTVPVHEERLEASTRPVDAGDVRVSKRVVTEQETVQVPVTEERVRVDWKAPSGDYTGEGAAFEEGTIEIPVSREEVDISKRTVQTGEVQVTKERDQRTQKVTDSVRKEVVDVDDTTDEAARNRR